LAIPYRRGRIAELDPSRECMCRLMRTSETNAGIPPDRAETPILEGRPLWDFCKLLIFWLHCT
ncbi:MAG: hypothetical protein Q7R39_19780, partial [Dehalococcoidia bacterium]|nr:hypothetical protein [Dehalococcoidia bacterium]